MDIQSQNLIDPKDKMYPLDKQGIDFSKLKCALIPNQKKRFFRNGIPKNLW